uniref:Sushi domain-containing protein n=1 Tax=Magallana gigas TaxID=29159 RepID=K1QGK3_MAGGI
MSCVGQPSIPDGYPTGAASGTPPTVTFICNPGYTLSGNPTYTCDTSTSCDIIQLACVAGEEMFNKYVFPNLTITPGATAVTGIYVKNGEMFVHNTRVQSVSVEKCIEELAEWLKQFHKPILSKIDIE